MRAVIGNSSAGTGVDNAAGRREREQCGQSERREQPEMGSTGLSPGGRSGAARTTVSEAASAGPDAVVLPSCPRASSPVCAVRRVHRDGELSDMGSSAYRPLAA